MTLEQASCGVADVQAKAEGFVRRRAENVDTMTTKEVTIVLPRGVGLSGQVTNPMNEPLPDARVSAGLASAITNAEGHYDLRFDPDRTSEVSAQAMNYIEQEERLRVAPDMPDLVIDWVLEPSRDLQVFCAGLPDDSCGDVMPLMCTLPWIPFGTLCHTVDNQALCTCPEGKSAVRGGGQSVEVAPGQQVAWLDFRVNGGLEGLVALQGSPLGCEIMAYRLPEDLSDVSRGGIAARRHKCNEEGGFEILGLEPGIYQVDVQVGNHQRRPDPVEVEDTVVDMGVIDLEDGTDVEGTVLDGATGQGAPNETVVAVQSATGGIATGTGFATSRSEGHFVLRGLKDGTWSVFLVSRPFTTVDITITEGTATPDHPTLETGAADLLDENGFGLATDEEGQLVVEGLEPDGAAAEAGLQEGDTIVGVTLMGMDVQGWLPGFGDALVDAVLDHYSGPGVGLVVVRDGEELEVALD